MKYDMFEKLACVYDDCMYDVSYTDWASYLKRFMAGETILEYGCGTGNLTMELLRFGFSVIALDNSAEMLTVAEAKFRGTAFQPAFVCADMTDFILQKPVDNIVAACDSVNYILEEDALKMFFGHAKRNLKHGGKLLFDMSSVSKLKNVLGNELFFDDAEDQTLFWQNAFDESNHTLTMDITLFVKDDGVYNRYDEQHLQRAWKVEEIFHALEDVGFSKMQVYTFGTLTPFSQNDDRIQFIVDYI